MSLPRLSREELLALVDERADAVRDYLLWAQAHDSEDGSHRMLERPDIADAAKAAELFPEQWWGVVVFTCFGSTLGATTVAQAFQRPLPPPDAEAELERTTFRRGSIGHHRIQPAHKGAKQALVEASCWPGEHQAVLRQVLLIARVEADGGHLGSDQVAEKKHRQRPRHGRCALRLA